MQRESHSKWRQPRQRTRPMLCTDCHNHLRNVWIGAITKRLSSYLYDILACDLEAIDNWYQISTMTDLRSLDKEFSLPANYPKGHGDVFQHWLKKYHPGAILVPVTHDSGSRQDHVLNVLHRCIGTGDIMLYFWMNVLRQRERTFFRRTCSTF